MATRFYTHIIYSSAALSALLAAGLAPLQALAARPSSAEARMEHAHELLGNLYDRSVVRLGEKFSDVHGFVANSTSTALRGKWKDYSGSISRAIVDESRKHGFDPIFVMALIQNESQFRPEARGSFGEIGLMQLKPSTAEAVARKHDIPWKGKKTLLDPVMNIRLGTAYLADLRGQFENHSRLYLAAYNMGSTNVRRALEDDIWPRDYPARVMHYYIEFYHQLVGHLTGGARPAKSAIALDHHPRDDG